MTRQVDMFFSNVRKSPFLVLNGGDTSLFRTGTQFGGPSGNRGQEEFQIGGPIVPFVGPEIPPHDHLRCDLTQCILDGSA